MYQAHFHLDQEPFSIAPDPSFLYLSTAHREALAHLMYGFSHGGFVLITGEVGTGKTTLLRNLLKQTPDDLDVAFILNPRLTVRELLETLCDELGVAYDGQATLSIKQFIDALNKHLLTTHQHGRSTVVIIDEAQNLSPTVLEQIRLLTNLETDSRKLLRIILVGQPELAELLARQELRQLAQRITARYHLGALSRNDSFAYVAHRISRAGGHPQIFSNGAQRRLYRLSRGIPRIINVIADRALLGAYAEGQLAVSARHVSRAAREVLGRPPARRRWIASGAVTVSLAGMAWAYLNPDALRSPWPQPDTQSLAANSPPQTGGGEEPSATDREPSATYGEPSASYGEPSATYKEPSATDREPSATHKEPSATYREPSAATEPGPPTDAEQPTTPPGEPASQLPSPASRGSSNAWTSLSRARQSPASSSTAEVPLPTDAEAPTATVGFVRSSVEGRPTAEVPLQRPAGTTYDSRRQAYAAIFERWGAAFPETSGDMIPCDHAPAAGLQCLTRKGDWSDIEQLNLPVVLELWDDRPGPYYVGLTALKEGVATIYVGTEALQVEQRDLRDLWSGSYVVLWQTPPGYRGSIRQGDRHETVSWLRQQLGAFNRVTLVTGQPDLFDEELHQAVIDFQRQEGLITDGVVGPATWITIADRLRLPAPSLS